MTVRARVHIAQACRTHPGCVIHYRRDPARNRLRGRATHVRSCVLYDGRLDGGFGVFEFSGWKPIAPIAPIIWDKEELRKVWDKEELGREDA